MTPLTPTGNEQWNALLTENKGEVLRWLAEQLKATSKPETASATTDTLKQTARANVAGVMQESPIIANLAAKAFAPALLTNPLIATEREELLADYLRDEPKATEFFGLLVRLQNSLKLMEHNVRIPRMMPQMVKELGEALYAWRPKGNDDTAFEEALAKWVGDTFLTMKLHNTVSIIRKGARFDQHRHHSTQNGTQVTDVHGWEVIRGDGLTLHKAEVTVS